MGKISDRVAEMILKGAKGREIVAEIARMEAKQEKHAIAKAACHAAFIEFWNAYPNRVGKPSAERAFTKAMQSGSTLEESLVGLRSYIADKPADRPWLMPATFLNDRRWEDQPAVIRKGRQDAFGAVANFFGGQYEDLQQGRDHGAQLALEPPVQRFRGF